MTILRRDRADCEELRNLHAKAAGFPFPPANPAHAARGHGFTTHQDEVRTEEDGRTSYDFPTDAELGPVRQARLTGAERARVAAIRAKPDTVAAAGRSQ